jgi:cation diffusion facilitator CzcD-associated flavoprotein CzcO
MTNGAEGAKGVNGSSNTLSTDVLIIGGGFGGMYGLHKFRQLGLDVKLFEAGGYFGGTWYWNRYPGARVDSETPLYSLSIPEVYKTWNFSERYVSGDELRRYFKHVDEVLGLSKDAHFNTIVCDAKYDIEAGEWHVHTMDGSLAKAKYLVCATGTSYKQHIPTFKNLDSFQGQLAHSAAYPADGLDVKGKKIAVIGSGATGLQLVQELAAQDCDLTAFVRTPNIALPMRQRSMTKDEQDATKHFYQALFTSAKQSRSGFPYNTASKTFHEATPKERRAHYEELWTLGGFGIVLGNYQDFYIDREANREIYQFWAEKTRQRIQNPVKRDIMAPLTQPHWFGTKRASLEQCYYEMIDRDNVTVIDLNKTPIVEFQEKGILTSEKLLEFDIIILATGFDAITGSLKNMGLTGTDNITLRQKWDKGTYTYLGLTIPKFPNLFMVYSPQAPTSLANGTAIIEVQVEWIEAAIRKMRETGIKYVDAQQPAAEKWREDVQAMANQTLFPETKSWYNG